MRWEDVLASLKNGTDDSIVSEGLLYLLLPPILLLFFSTGLPEHPLGEVYAQFRKGSGGHSLVVKQG